MCVNDEAEGCLIVCYCTHTRAGLHQLQVRWGEIRWFGA